MGGQAPGHTGGPGTAGALPPLVEAVEAVFAPGGPLERLVPGYRHRPGQVEMARAVAAALEAGEHLAVEAATGIGKSLAYLVPAALWAHRHGARVVVATHTLALQDQIRARDLPVIEQIVPVTAAVLKGFGQYACRLQADALLQETAAQGGLWTGMPSGGDEPEGHRRDPAVALAAWLESTATGELAELAGPALGRLAARLGVDAGACLGSGCPAARRCFPLLAREQAQRADLIVTNHALVLADWASGGRLLPAYDALIVDEAHHLEDVAAQQLGCRLHPGELLRAVAALAAGGGGATGTGGPGGAGAVRGPGDRGDRSEPAVPGDAADGHPGGMDGSAEVADPGDPGPGDPARTAYQVLRRLAAVLDRLSGQAPDGVRRLPPGWRDPRGPEGDLARALAAAGDALATLLAHLEHQPAPVEERAYLAFRRHRQRLQEAVATVQRLLGDAAGPGERAGAGSGAGRGSAGGMDSSGDGAPAGGHDGGDRGDGVGDGLCAWVEPQAGGAQLIAAPVEPGGTLEPLFAAVPVVLASATLPRDDHWLQRLGIGAARRLAIPSPFDLQRQALLAVVTDAPRPPSRPDPAYAAQLAQLLLPIIEAVPGGVLVLFTARWALDSVGEMLRPVLRARGRRPALQDRDGPRSHLVAALAAGQVDVLMGVDSLWEGIDVPGRRLEGVILTRIPFDSPAEPLTAARCEVIEARGGSAFFQYQLPRAAVKLKQGFGRLIRSAEDRGVVVVLDPRLAPGSSRYAWRLLEGLPPARRWVGPAAAAVGAVAGWFDGDEPATGTPPAAAPGRPPGTAGSSRRNG
ncbi:helicase c2 [Thermaerobacter marianensis DSM 12885]|uniref:Helicase c2 n=1 Tax=Thermaerobacter marianensis (strain ATCC 700841 / DSM 12885 / JCM 10246 / 7p75a) TaxID=644966 RepID=E6SK65_THEM7|nr:helicase C-terminal domain-containing protein [Thermaerobacter marianensis]ADU51206.1 helicase c2 [Thermaerobacter marianensis DSM 12885]